MWCHERSPRHRRRPTGGLGSIGERLEAKPDETKTGPRWAWGCVASRGLDVGMRDAFQTDRRGLAVRESRLMIPAVWSGPGQAPLDGDRKWLGALLRPEFGMGRPLLPTNRQLAWDGLSCDPHGDIEGRNECEAAVMLPYSRTYHLVKTSLSLGIRDSSIRFSNWNLSQRVGPTAAAETPRIPQMQVPAWCR